MHIANLDIHGCQDVPLLEWSNNRPGGLHLEFLHSEEPVEVQNRPDILVWLGNHKEVWIEVVKPFPFQCGHDRGSVKRETVRALACNLWTPCYSSTISWVQTVTKADTLPLTRKSGGILSLGKGLLSGNGGLWGPVLYLKLGGRLLLKAWGLWLMKGLLLGSWRRPQLLTHWLCLLFQRK